MLPQLLGSHITRYGTWVVFLKITVRGQDLGIDW